MDDGKVYLVGAGPGNPDLMTLKAVKTLKRADVVIYDSLVTKDVMKNVPSSAKKIFVGKRPGSHTMPQNKINRIMIEKAREGKTVVRLKGGDPFLFGRGGEETQDLRKQGIKFEIVPGVTSALAAPAYAGIPLTHRAYASSVAIVTGHEDPHRKEARVNWSKLATAVDTIVVLMGVEKLAGIVEELIKGGRKPKTKVAIIEWGTTKHQKVVIGVLGDIVGKAVEHRVKSPAVVVIGDVVRLQDELSWFRRSSVVS